MTQLEFLRRRQALLAQMVPGSAALIFAAPEATRSADSEYPYRQNSDFWYFTGFNEPEAVLVLIWRRRRNSSCVMTPPPCKKLISVVWACALPVRSAAGA